MFSICLVIKIVDLHTTFDVTKFCCVKIVIIIHSCLYKLQVVDLYTNTPPYIVLISPTQFTQISPYDFHVSMCYLYWGIVCYR